MILGFHSGFVLNDCRMKLDYDIGLGAALSG